jgi:DNA-binding NtrC family response regulator
MGHQPIILIVDDDLESLHNRTVMFADSGMTVREAVSREEAEALLEDRSHAIDLAILDINLTGDPLDRSGVQLAQLLREQFPTVPVVAYSAYYTEDELSPELRHLFTDWVVKGSMSVKTLDEFVERCSSLARTHRDGVK